MDPEKGNTAMQQGNPKLVTWDGPDDPLNAKNWTASRKWSVTIVVSFYTFVSALSSSMVAPALSTIAKDFHVNNEIESQMMLSVFVLAYAVGPLFLAPLSEIYGRVIVLQLSNLFFLVFNIACAVCQSKGQMIAFRFLSGLGGSAPTTIGGGVLSDCFTAEQRGKSMAIYSLAPLLGPAVGPIAGGFITQNISWRWIFYTTSIFDGLLQAVSLFTLHETYGPKILSDKAKLLRKSTGDADFHTESDQQTILGTLQISLIRPFRMLATQPIIQFLAVYMAFIYGLMYLVLSTFTTLWTSPNYYNESVGIGCLNYIALGIGFWGGSQICAPLNDRIYRALAATRNGVGQPEFRVPLLTLSAILTPIGLFIYGWTAQEHTHWIGPDIGACIISIGIISGFLCVQTYVVDAYTKYAASALSAVVFLRCLAGFGFPLFAPYMYNALHYGWGNSVLGFVAIGIGIPAPLFLWRFGPKLRGMSTYAAG
ncbi:hypothetical protein ASPWEDRAFT_167610 [Aspergillus wentii DTO 134E9]|uniref:Major facilitator superfamily (MFS) profile domain-containing protein n=1 Tax=Aspergillus wentii DTO 134E9 TaxID=1073089 RepID=A0A1L9S366_ASPWE|nr:uncharacterized protein ASPWEDRAFT_167610 [Aspergillus wentii DTO 134E9]OJJ41598.1 hypothetical protein ASPWEDRAFT_167610 [Aspergillus wentii DTO 134E9]